MGDIVHSLPAVAAIREQLPEAVIGWAVEERWSELLSSASARVGPRGPQKPLVDTLHVVDTRAWRRAPLSRRTWSEIREAVRELRQKDYDFSIDIQGAIKSSVLGRLAKPRHRIGFAQPWESSATLFYTQQVDATGTHIVDRNLSLASPLKVSQHATRPFPLPMDPAAEEWADHELKKRGYAEFAILNPGAGWGSKRWPSESFSELASRLSKNRISSFINFGPGEENIAHEVENASRGAAARISCSLGELIALTRRAKLFVGGDTGPLHLAVALNTPSVALFGPTNPERNGPYGGPAITLRSPQSVTTYKRSAQVEGGLASITVDEVVAAAGKLLERNLG